MPCLALSFSSHLVDMSPSDIIIATLFYQFSLYVCVRLARRGFTLGELGVVCTAATALFMETVNLTRMRVSSIDQSLDGAHRHPDPHSSNTIHQDISPAHPSPHLPTCADPRITPGWLPPLPPPLPVPAPGSTPSTSPTIPTRKTNAPPPSRLGVLRRHSAGLRRSSGDMDGMVSWPKPIYLDNLLAPARPTSMDSARTHLVLGSLGCHLGRRVESAARKGQATSTIRRPGYSGASSDSNRLKRRSAKYCECQCARRRNQWGSRADDRCCRSKDAGPERQCEAKVFPCFGCGHVCPRHCSRRECLSSSPEGKADLFFSPPSPTSPSPSPLQPSISQSTSDTLLYGRSAFRSICSSTNSSMPKILGRPSCPIFTSLRDVRRPCGSRAIQRYYITLGSSR